MKLKFLLFLFLTIFIMYTIDLNKTSDITISTMQTTTISQQTTTEQSKTTTTDQTFINLTFDNGVEINAIKPIYNFYLAMGEENNIPYMQVIHVTNNVVTSSSSPYLFTSGKGTVTDITSHDYYITATINDNNTTYTQDFIENNDQFIPFYDKQIQYNYYEGMTITPLYLVIHETDNTAVGANALAHFNYWNSNPNALASTHFVVDSTQVYEMLQLNQAGWHVGDNNGYSDITNYNSIGIEICVNSDGNYAQARENAINLAIEVMKDLNMNISQLKRHYDASGKDCPRTMVENPELWTDFVSQVEQGLSN